MEEILSIGEKIRRTRVYKNYTLKDLCNDKLSVSKLSCIENDKIKPDIDTLQYIAKKLEVDIQYLKYGINDQLKANIDKIKSGNIDGDIENNIKTNLKIAKEYYYDDIAYTFIRMLFNYYIDRRLNKKIQDIIPEYYELCVKLNDENNVTKYFLDMGRYLLMNNEYEEAAENFKNARYYFDKKGIHDEKYIKTILYETRCYFMDTNVEEAEKMKELLEEYKDKIENKNLKGRIYHILSVLYYLEGKQQYKEYFDKSFELFGNDYRRKALSYINFSYIHFKMNDKQKGVELAEKAKNIFPKDKIRQYVSFLIISLKLLINNKMYDMAESICDETLDCAIKYDDTMYIEKAYYYKSILLFKAKNITTAEMYMNLSLGLFEKIASKNDIYLRYMEIGQIYYKLGLKKEAFRYFGIATTLSKKI